MAILYSYPLGTPQTSDLIIGTKMASSDTDDLPITQNYSIGSVLGMIATTTGAQTFNQVANLGSLTVGQNETIHTITFKDIYVKEAYKDSDGLSGNAGEILSSTGTKTLWIPNAAVGVASITGTTPIVVTGTTTPVISHANSGVTATSYTNADITVNASGHVISASNGTGGYTLPAATIGALGGIKIGYTDNAKNYAVELDTDNEAFVNVPWTDTVGAVTSVDEETPGTSAGTPIVVDPTTGAVKVKSMAYAGTTNVGHVPAGGLATTYLKGDGTWGAIPTGLQFQEVWSAAGTAGGAPDLTTVTPAEGWLYIVSVAGDAEPNGPTGTQLSPWAVGDWCVYSSSLTAWTRVPSSTVGVTTFQANSAASTYLTMAPTGASQNAVTLTADLSALDGTSDTNTKFLSKDNTWDVPSYTTNTDTIYDLLVKPSTTFALNGGTGYTPISSVVIGNATTVVPAGGTGMTVDITINASGVIVLPVVINNPGSGYSIGDTVTITGGDGNAEIILSGTTSNLDPNLRLINQALVDDDVKLTGTNATTVTRTSDNGITINSLNTQNTYTGGTGITLNSFEFDVNVDATASAAPQGLSTTTNQTYKVQLDDQSENLVVNVPWQSGGTYTWLLDAQTSGTTATIDSGDTVDFKGAGGILVGHATSGTTTTTTFTGSGIPAVLTDGADPGVTSLYANTTGAAVRTTIGAGTMSNFTVGADTVTVATSISQGETLTLAGGTNVTTVSNDGTITINSTDQYVGTVTSVGVEFPQTDAGGDPTMTGFVVSNSGSATAPNFQVKPISGGTGTAAYYINGLGNPALFPDIFAGTITSVGVDTGGDAFTSTPTQAAPTSTGAVNIAITPQGDATNYINGAGDLADVSQFVPTAGGAMTGDLSVSNEITVTSPNFSNPGKVSIEGVGVPLLQLKNTDQQTGVDQVLGTLEFYGSDVSGSPAHVAGVRASITANTGFTTAGSNVTARNQGCLEFATYNGSDVSNSPLQRLKITPDGGFSFGSTSTAYGSQNQLLQSNGDAPPTWVNAPSGDVTLTGTQTLTNKTLTAPVIDQISPSAGLLQIDGASMY